MSWFGKFSVLVATEYMKDYRESRAHTFDTIIKNNLHLNTVILTVSIAALTAVVALNDKVFISYPELSIAVVSLFILVILFSTINFYLSGLALSDLQQKLNKDILFPFRVSRGEYCPKFKPAQSVLSVIVLGGFCLGLAVLLVLFSLYILGVKS